jgi:ADP-ribosyl-[dinitrogen reductase] hydrolase
MPAGLNPAPPRPLDETYWVVPGRLLVGQHPGSRSRAQAMERVRHFVDVGINFFIDLTEPGETPSYDNLLPETSPSGAPVKYLREPIIDHGLPAGADQMARILGSIDDALADGHNVYLHCRAGIGRSALAAGCWLAEKHGSTTVAAAELNELWKQAAQSQSWTRVPETDAQVEYLQRWLGGETTITSAIAGAGLAIAERVRGAWYGLALGDALGALEVRDTQDPVALRWTQPTALALCLANSLLELQRLDARDQMERYLRWQREGYCAADGAPGDPHVTPDVKKAIATYQWRGLPMAGSHDPRDAAATSLPRVLAAVCFNTADPAAAIALASDSARTTHQSPVVLDSCRFYAATLLCALQGQPAEQWLKGVCEPAPGIWKAKPLRHGVVGMAKGAAVASAATVPAILRVFAQARRTLRAADRFEDAIASAVRDAGDGAALQAAVTGTLYGARYGLDALPQEKRQALIGRELLDSVTARFIARGLEPRA